jgi:hypothetical protein
MRTESDDFRFMNNHYRLPFENRVRLPQNLWRSPYFPWFIIH